MLRAVTPLSFDDITVWLKSLLSEKELSKFPEFREGPYIHETPDRLCTLTLSSGAGYAMEGAADQPQFQIRVRSDQNKQQTASYDINLLDMRIFQARFPTKLASGMNLLLVSRVGGSPAPLGPPDAAYRYDYTGNYAATVGVSR